jgi:hypothetical protein
MYLAGEEFLKQKTTCNRHRDDHGINIRNPRDLICMELILDLTFLLQHSGAESALGKPRVHARSKTC